MTNNVIQRMHYRYPRILGSMPVSIHCKDCSSNAASYSNKMIIWYVCEIERGPKIEVKALKDLKQHLEVVFIFLAFRSIMTYFLPQNPSEYGVQRVTPDLPLYAKQMRYYLPLLFY